MSNHSEIPLDGLHDEGSRKLLKAIFDSQASLGATKQFPEGAVTSSDEGEIKFRVGAEFGRVFMNFGKPVSWIGMTPTQVNQLCSVLMSAMNNARMLDPDRKQKEVAGTAKV